MQWWFKKFCKGEENLEDEEHSGWSLEVYSDQLRALIEAGLFQLWEVTEELNTDHSMIVQYLKQFEKGENTFRMESEEIWH